MHVIKNFLAKILESNSKMATTEFALKGIILFKREDVVSSKVLDYDFEEGQDVSFSYEKFV